MTHLIDFARRRPVLSIVIVVIALALAVVAVLLGAKIWQALLGLLGLGAGATQPLRVFARKDQERLQSQAEIDAWKANQTTLLDQTRMKDEQAIRVELGKKHNSIDKATETETPDQIRKRILDASRGPLQAILWGSLFLLAGCAHSVGAPGAVTRDVCFSKQEAGDILKRIADLQAAVKQCQVGATHAKQLASVECQALVARWQLEARVCSDKLVACTARTCPTCWLPWLIAGVSLAAATGVGIYAGVRLSGVVR